MKLPVAFALALILPTLCQAEETVPSANAPRINMNAQAAAPAEPIDLAKRNEELKNNLQELQNANNALTLELEHTKSLAADEIKLNDDNKKLLVQYETAKREHDTLNAENQSLKEQLKQNTFINGAIAVILGMLGTLIIQYFARSKKRYSDWA